MRHLVLALGLVAFAVPLASPVMAVEGVAERQARKKLEAQKYPNLGHEALQNNDPDKAIEYYTRAIDSRAFNDQPQTMGELYQGRGTAWRMKKDCVRALEDFDKALQTLQEGDIYFSRAACYLEMKRDDEALRDFDQAIKLDPDALMYRRARCILLFNRKDFAGALPDCVKAASAMPTDKDLLTATSQAAEQSGDRARAAEFYRKLLAVDPGNSIATEGLVRTGG